MRCVGFKEGEVGYPDAFHESVKEKVLPKDCQLRRVKYLNNITLTGSSLDQKESQSVTSVCRSFHTAAADVRGIEAVNLMRKGQVKRLDGKDAQGQAKFVESLFQVAA